MNKIAIIGAGSHTRSSVNLLKQHFKIEQLKIYDDSFSENIEYINDVPLVGTISDIDNDEKVFISIGDNKKREEYFDFFHTKIIEDNFIHDKVYLENNIKFGVSNQIFANVYINTDVKIGDNNIINTSAILEHEVKIGNHNHISVGAKLCGRAQIGDRCMIGAGAIIIDKLTICDDVVIGAGAVVIKNINKSGTYVGNPARKVK